MKDISVLKSEGVEEAFDEQKLRRSLHKSGASKLEIDATLTKIKALLYDGITTKKIHDEAFKILKSYSKSNAARYRLKKGIRELGPSGYPFERYFGHLLKFEGYHVETGIIVQGHCIQHEVDVIGRKDSTYIAVECKFHTDPGKRCDVKIPLYIHSRFEDIQNRRKAEQGNEDIAFQGWLATNTRFTQDALQYGKCAGLTMVSWDQGKGRTLSSMVTSSRLYPVTCLTSITHKEKSKLLAADIVLCSDLCTKANQLNEIGISLSRQKSVLDEAHALCDLQIPKN